MASQQTQKELVRLLVIEHGQKVASDLSEVPYETVRKWTQRGNWLTSQSVPRPVQTAVNNVQSELAEAETETKLSLARYARRAAKDSEQLSVRESPYVHKVGQVAGLVHKWGDEKPNQQFTLNVLNLNVIEDSQAQDTK